MTGPIYSLGMPTGHADIDASPAAALFLNRDGVPERAGHREGLLARLARWADGAAMVLLLLATGALLFRPADLIPSLEGAPIYELCMVGCIVCALPRIAPLLRWASLRGDAITALAAAFVPAVVLSHLSHGDTWNARVGGGEAFKAFVMYLLIVGLASSAGRLRLMLLAIAGSTLLMTVIGLLSYFRVIDVPAFTTVEQPGREGSPDVVRLCATGIFNDPNDLSMILVLCGCVCVYVMGWRAAGARRWLSVPVLGVFGLALVLTYSRGGMLAAVAGAAALIVARFGWRNAIPVLGVLGLIVAVPIWGRQTELNLADPDDTFQARLELWSSSLDLFRGEPVLGIGQGNLVDAIGQVTHNSFLHAFVELGVVGGAVFIGGFFLAIRGLSGRRPDDHELARMRPCLLGVTFGYAAGLLTLSRCYTVPTQMVLGLAAAYLRLASGESGTALTGLSARTVSRVVGISVLFLGATYVFVRVMLHR